MPRIVLSILLLASVSLVRAEVIELDAAALEDLLARDVVVVDVRREDEWRERGVLEGSHPLTFFDAHGGYDVEVWLDELAKLVTPDQPLVLVCAHGTRSKRIADLLDTRLGFSDVHNVTDGIEGWRASGGRIVPYAP